MKCELVGIVDHCFNEFTGWTAVGMGAMKYRNTTRAVGFRVPVNGFMKRRISKVGRAKVKITIEAIE